MGTIAITEAGARALGDSHWVITSENDHPVLTEMHQVIDYDPLPPMDGVYGQVWSLAAEVGEPKVAISLGGSADRFIQKVTGGGGTGFNDYKPLHLIGLVDADKDWNAYTTQFTQLHAEATKDYTEVGEHIAFWSAVTTALLDSAGDSSIRAGFIQALTIAKIGSGSVVTVPGTDAETIDWTHVIARLMALLGA